ncbi:GNAT family N-acetyltransferase [Hymenobacter bucti]|uniref:GNAT family N-acetyltransferase n=1 Tax=Hymenobacter bucti TaxID=1844114 RepID=A0ABW4R1M6_9BACT
MTIQSITPAQTYALRHAVLWPAKPLEYIKLPDDNLGQHFGAFEGDQLVAVLSLFVDADGVARFRKFATAAAWQGQGIGSALLRHAIEAARAQGVHSLWCDARHNTLAFYARFGLEPEGDIFYKGPIPYMRVRRYLP